MIEQLVAYMAAHGKILAISSVIIFLAGIVRGFSGFGFSLIAIISLTLMMPPKVFVPTIFLLEIAASLHMLRDIWRDIDWRSIRWLLLGYAAALPFGIFALARFPEPPMQLAMSIFVLATAIMMLCGFRLERTPGAKATTITGAASGIFNGAFGIGGPPVVLFYFSTPAAAAVSRASIVAFFLSTDVLGLCGHFYEGLLTMQIFAQFLIWLPALLIGVWVGGHGFRRIDQALFRRLVLLLLTAMAVLTFGKAIYAWSLA